MGGAADYRVERQRLDLEVVHQLGRLDLIANLVAEDVRRGMHRSRRRGFSSEFSDFTPYIQGDDPRRIDWRVFARTDELFVRRYEAETSVEVLILLDATRSMAWRWQDKISKLEYAGNLLGAMACLHLGQQDRVGLLLHDAERLHFLAPSSRRRQLPELFAVLSGVEPGTDETFPRLVESLAWMRRHRGRIVICSDLEEDEDEITAAFDELAGREDEIVVFHLLDVAEEELPFTEGTHLQDSETGAIMPVNLAAIRRDHAANVHRFREHWRRACEDWRLRYLPVHTAMDYTTVLTRFADLMAR